MGTYYLKPVGALAFTVLQGDSEWSCTTYGLPIFPAPAHHILGDVFYIANKYTLYCNSKKEKKLNIELNALYSWTSTKYQKFALAGYGFVPKTSHYNASGQVMS